MGAELWYHQTPWRANPEEALRDLQVRFLAESYDLPSLVQEHLQSVREAVKVTEATGDPHKLLDLYRRDLAFLEEASRRPLPDDPQQQMELLRKIFASGGEGIGNVLDVTGVSDDGGLYVTRRLSTDEIRRFCLTERPTRADAEAAVDRINIQLGRAESVCFPIYSDAPEARPVGWYFVGNTFD